MTNVIEALDSLEAAGFERGAAEAILQAVDVHSATSGQLEAAAAEEYATARPNVFRNDTTMISGTKA